MATQILVIRRNCVSSITIEMLMMKGNNMIISDIYAGKPDASDEIKERGYEEFAGSYIMPSGVNIERLASADYGTPFFIMGDKGSGKTALLFFLQNYIRTKDPSACSSFIFFDSGFSHVTREKFNSISKSISTSILIDNSIASIGQNIECDFTYIWRWQFYQKLIIDNDNFNGGLFVDDANWIDFTNEINKISKTINKEKMHIPAKVSFNMTTNPQFGTITPGFDIEPIDFTQCNFNQAKNYSEFVTIIEKADSLAKSLKRTDIPYYIFIDELEAYRGANDTFYRDLRMIRDLLFTVKWMNDIFLDGTKLVCSVRLEILNAINRFIQSNQLHKIMMGYDERLIWEHTNTNSFSHPIIGVLLKRIQNAEEKATSLPVKQADIIRNWFKPTVYNTHICSYILDNTWHKPRDIVRLLLSAQSKNSKNFSIFNQNTFDTFMPAYSKQCLVEVQEEMRALYEAEEIENIFNCLQGYKMIFSFQEIFERAKTLYPTSVLAKDPCTVLSDMYRVGVIGNYLNKDHSPRWEYKEQYKLIIDSPWKMIVHPALRIELAVNSRIDRYIDDRKTEIKKTDSNHNIVFATVEEIRDRYILVSFNKDGCNQNGYIFMKNLGINSAEEGKLSSLVSLGQTVKAELMGYANYIACWLMRVVD